MTLSVVPPGAEFRDHHSDQADPKEKGPHLRSRGIVSCSSYHPNAGNRC